MNYIALRPLERPQRTHHPNKPDTIRQVILGQFPLSLNLVTGEFALDGSRLTIEQWIDLRSGVDTFLRLHGWLEILQVSLEETDGTIVKHEDELPKASMLSRLRAWLTKR